MKVKEIEKVAKNKKGHLNKNGIKPEPNEEIISKNVDAVEKKILDLFKNNGRVRRLMIIRENGSLIDFIK